MTPSYEKLHKLFDQLLKLNTEAMQLIIQEQQEINEFKNDQFADVDSINELQTALNTRYDNCLDTELSIKSLPRLIDLSINEFREKQDNLIKNLQTDIFTGMDLNNNLLNIICKTPQKSQNH